MAGESLCEVNVTARVRFTTRAVLSEVKMPRKVEGIDYSPDGIEDIREQVIKLRDEAIEQNEFEWVVVLTHTVALLAYLKELTKHGSQS